MKYAIIENEKYLSDNLRMVISSMFRNYECEFTAECVDDSICFFSQQNDVDLIFMDIELDDGSCFEIFNEVEIDIPVIFITSYSEYAIEAFKVNSVDYLLKPIDENDLRRAIEKFEKRNRNERKASETYRRLGSERDFPTQPPCKRILVSHSDNYSYIFVSDIAWLEAEGRYVSIITNSGQNLLTDIKSLGDVAMVLNQDDFFQISRGVVASIGSIKRVSKYFKGRLKVELQAGEKKSFQIVSAARREPFLNWLGYV